MITPNDIELILTCSACPEQYDAYYGTEQVGYLRLRHGCFTVDCPDCGETEVMCSFPEGDGVFEYNERAHYLDRAKEVIAEWYNSKNK